MQSNSLLSAELCFVCARGTKRFARSAAEFTVCTEIKCLGYP